MNGLAENIENTHALDDAINEEFCDLRDYYLSELARSARYISDAKKGEPTKNSIANKKTLEENKKYFSETIIKFVKHYSSSNLFESKGTAWLYFVIYLNSMDFFTMTRLTNDEENYLTKIKSIFMDENS